MAYNLQTFQQTADLPFRYGEAFFSREKVGIAIMGLSMSHQIERVLPEKSKNLLISRSNSYSDELKKSNHQVGSGLSSQQTKTYRSTLAHNASVPNQPTSKRFMSNEVAGEVMSGLHQAKHNGYSDMLSKLPVQRVRTLFHDCGEYLKNQDKIVFTDAVNQLIEGRNASLIAMLNDIDILVADEDYDEECIKPTLSAIEGARTILEGASRYVNGYFPYGTVYPDGDGGLRTEWIEPGCELRLVIPANQNGSHYIYHERNDDFKNDYDVTPIRLGYWLNWLNKYANSTG
jgi:hypothetical protein